MNIVKIKGYISAAMGIIALTWAVNFIYKTGSESLKGIINREDYFFYDPKDIPLFLFIPVAIYFELICVCVLMPFKIKTRPFIQKMMYPVAIYCVAAFVIGTLSSIVISFYPLGTDYVKCHSTSIVSSGSSYAKSKEICKQRGSDGY